MINLHKIQPVNLDAIREKSIRNRINRVGVEVEGGWTELPNGARPVRDGSLDRDPPAGRIIGEIASPPLVPEEVEAWMGAYHPHHVTNACGLHVHMSFRNPFVYQRLMDPTYPATVVAELVKWSTKKKIEQTHTIWGRLRGESVYCKHVFHADEQIRNKNKDYDRDRPGHRYTIINYCYNVHQTLECRVLPMFPTVEQSYAAVREVMDITNAFLAATAKREPKIRTTIEDDDSGVVMERRIYV